METLGTSRILGVLLCAFCLLSASFEKVTIPAELKSAVVKIVVNATSCSVTCGLGVKLEEMCEMTPAGERRNCTVRRSGCLTSWVCGLLHFTLPAGKPFQFSCLTSDAAGFGSQAYSYTWRLAPALVTTNDVLFKPFKNPGSVIRFSPVRESDAGTYRCDVQVLKTFKVVKRVYFGVRVIQTDLVDLNFQKSLTWEQKLAANEEEGNTNNGTHEEVQEQQPFWQRDLFYECLVGIGSGVIGGVLVSVVLCFLWKILRKRAAK
ncbi:transmembrane protein 81 [Falco peregrinus]|uniref:transmembrane protein 81 n=1 Tax=Falco peregrinus TaxID=8954 RepID=UPI00247A8D1E|nr:transmembrane protein 81 [Falco peregrinus]